MDDEFTTLWNILPHPPDSVIRLFSRSGDVRTGDYAKSAREIRKYATEHKGKNVYVAPNPTLSTRGLRHTAAEVSHWSYFLIDMDPIKKKASPLKAMCEALNCLANWTGFDFIRNSPILIDSGRGVQAWIRLEDVLLGEEQAPGGGMSRSVARRINGYWLKRLDEKLGEHLGSRIDTSVSDLPRVMRCPGTINEKTQRPTKFLHATDYVFKGLAKTLERGTPAEVLRDPPVPEGLARDQKWQRVFPHLTLMAQAYLLHGQEEPGRHKVMWHTAKKFHELGVARSEARRALQRANRLCGPDAALPLDQVEHALTTAYGPVIK